jgi:hypothetical protein
MADVGQFKSAGSCRGTRAVRFRCQHSMTERRGPRRWLSPAVTLSS